MDALGIGQVAELATSVINKIWPDKSEQEKQQLAMALTIIQGQLETNKSEAINPDRFVAGWRPFIGWICGLACAWNWIGISMARLALETFQIQVSVAPASLTEMLPILIGMLGLGAYRTTEKLQGKA